jgi:hypothetical protein
MEVKVVNWLEALSKPLSSSSTSEMVSESYALRFFRDWTRCAKGSWPSIISRVMLQPPKRVVWASSVLDLANEPCSLEQLSRYIVDGSLSIPDPASTLNGLRGCIPDTVHDSMDESERTNSEGSVTSYKDTPKFLRYWPLSLRNEQDRAFCIWFMLIVQCYVRLPLAPGLTPLHLNVLLNALTWYRRGRRPGYVPHLLDQSVHLVAQWQKNRYVLKYQSHYKDVSHAEVMEWSRRDALNLWHAFQTDAAHTSSKTDGKVDVSSVDATRKTLQECQYVIQYIQECWQATIKTPSQLIPLWMDAMLVEKVLFTLWPPSTRIRRVLKHYDSDDSDSEDDAYTEDDHETIVGVSPLELRRWGSFTQARWIFIRFWTALMGTMVLIESTTGKTLVQFSHQYQESIRFCGEHLTRTDQWDLFFTPRA